MEQALAETGLPHSILRPDILFGNTPTESILINNMAWGLRHLPAVSTFGRGNYRLQPIHVQDFAELAMDEAEATTPARIINAEGSETCSFRATWQLLAGAMGLWRPILPVPAWLGYQAARVLGALLGDVMLTRDEVTGLCRNLLAVPGPSIGQRRLSCWVRENAAVLGREYSSELGRRG